MNNSKKPDRQSLSKLINPERENRAGNEVVENVEKNNGATLVNFYNESTRILN